MRKDNLLIISYNDFSKTTKSGYEKVFDKVNYIKSIDLTSDFNKARNSFYKYILVIEPSDIKENTGIASIVFRKIKELTNQEKKQKEIKEEEKRKQLEKNLAEEKRVKEESLKNIPKEAIPPAIIADILIVNPTKALITVLDFSEPVDYDYKSFDAITVELSLNCTIKLYDSSNDSVLLNKTTNNQKIFIKYINPGEGWIKYDEKQTVDIVNINNYKNDVTTQIADNFLKYFYPKEMKNTIINFEEPNDKYSLVYKKLILDKNYKEACTFIQENLDDILKTPYNIIKANHLYNLATLYKITNDFNSSYKYYSLAYNFLKLRKYLDEKKYLENLQINKF